MASQTPPDWRNKIMHARMSIGDVALMGSDAPPDRYQKPQGVMVSVGIDAPPEAERVFQALSEGGVVTMPIQETFWAQRFAMLTDRFASPWMGNCEQPQKAVRCNRRAGALLRHPALGGPRPLGGA